MRPRLKLSSVPNSILVLGINIAGSLLGLALEFVLARSMSVVDYGEFRYVYSIAIIVSGFTLFGGGQRLVRAAAKYGTSVRMEKEIGTSLALSGIALALASAFILAAHIYGAMSITSTLVAGLLLAWIALRTLFQLYRSINIGNGNYIAAQLSDRILLNGIPFLITLALIIIGLNQKNTIATFCALIGTAGALLSSIFIAYRGGWVRPKKPSLPDLINRISSSTFIAVAEGADAFIRLGSVTVAAYFISLSEVAAFALVVRLTEALGLIQSAATAVYARKIMLGARSASPLETRQSLKAFANFCSSFLFIAAAFTFVIGDHILGSFGDFYRSYGSALSAVVAALFVKQLMGPWQLLLIARGRERLLAASNVLFSALLLLSVMAGARCWGFNGVILAYAAVMLLHSLTLTAYCRFALGICTWAGVPGIRTPKRLGKP